MRQTARGRALIAQLELPKNSTWADCVAYLAVERSMSETQAFVELRNALEGAPTTRQIVENIGAQELIIHVIREQGLEKK